MTHQQCLNYANCWKMTDANDGNVYYLLYVHQLLLYGLLGTSSAMIISALTILAISKMMQKKLKSTVVVPILILASMTFLYLLQNLISEFLLQNVFLSSTDGRYSELWQLAFVWCKINGELLGYPQRRFWQRHNIQGYWIIDFYVEKDVENSEIVAKNSYRKWFTIYLHFFIWTARYRWFEGQSVSSRFRAGLQWGLWENFNKFDLVVLRHYFPKSLFITDPLLVSEYFGKRSLPKLACLAHVKS